MSLRRVLGVYSIRFLFVYFQPINALSPRTATNLSSVKPDFPTEKRKSCQFIFVFFSLKVQPPKAAQINGFILRDSYYKIMLFNIFLLFLSREICLLVEHSKAQIHTKSAQNSAKNFCLKQTFTQNLETGFFFFRVAIKVLVVFLFLNR